MSTGDHHAGTFLQAIDQTYTEIFYVILSCDGFFKLAGGLKSPLSTCKIRQENCAFYNLNMINKVLYSDI